MLIGAGVKDVWAIVEPFRARATESGVLEKRGRPQTLEWVYAMVDERLRSSFFRHAGVERAVVDGKMPPTVGCAAAYPPV